MEIRQLANGLIKAMLFFAFYMAGVLSSEYLSQLTISLQKDQIESLQNEIAIQRLQINELNRRASINAENLQELRAMKVDLQNIKNDIQSLNGLHK